MTVEQEASVFNRRPLLVKFQRQGIKAAFSPAAASSP